jgi:hypothetical protein
MAPNTSDEFSLGKCSIPNGKSSSIFTDDDGSNLKILILLVPNGGLQHLLSSFSQSLTQHITDFTGGRVLGGNLRIVDAPDCLRDGFLITVLHGWRSFRGELVFVW